MKKVAVTVAVLALGLAACAKNNDADNMTANDMYTENTADTDMNMSINAEEAASNALDTASNAIDNAGEAVENAGDAVENTTTNE
ncbi:MAG TPA: hypothetical protein VFI88_02010 [Sphingomicrobium sp.]|jgi:outer membrane lipoprotein SlyB|nr:hypothetical protein [Sphingomicrobium sp.]